MAKSKVSNVVELPTVNPKKKVVRFESSDEDAPVSNIYVSNALVEKLGGCEDGIRITVEAL